MTSPPKPEGAVYFHYSPMSPPCWGLFPFATHVYVYSNIHEAMRAMDHFMGLFQQKWASSPYHLSGETVFYRGQKEISQRILPTRLRGRNMTAAPRMRSAVPPEARETEGNWYEEDPESRSHEQSMDELPAGELQLRDRKEQLALDHAESLPDLAHLSPFQRRAAVRHYADVPSPLLDVSIDLEVAAFFATGAGTSVRPGQLGMLWAFDLNFLRHYLEMKVSIVRGGWKIAIHDRAEAWGDNKQMLEDFGLLPARFDLNAVDLPLPRPSAQKGRFISLETAGGDLLDPRREFLWWSIFERWSCPIGFIQDGTTYENPVRGITANHLLPADDSNILLFQSLVPSAHSARSV